MKNALLFLKLISGFYLFAQVDEHREVPKEFSSVWIEFSRALENNDKNKFQELCLFCIHCSECAENTYLEDSLMNAEEDADADLFYDKFYNVYSIIPIKKFLEEDYDILFSEDVRLRAQISTQLFFVQHEKLKTKDLDNCLRASIKSKSANRIEVLITVDDPSEIYEGTQFCLNFIETQIGYRFYAFYTIP